jgi:NADPH:quinone reductase-like Zn-dependent oxidoreductase
VSASRECSPWQEGPRVRISLPPAESHIATTGALSDGSLRPIIDRSFTLTEIAEAQAYLEADKHVGKVVIRV